ncbi:sulfotransferase 6B1-like isoform 2-T2 [Discoglossus pictus]
MSAPEQTQERRKQFQLEVEKLLEGKSPDELLFTYKGVLYPLICTEETLEALGSLEARDDDLLIVTYPKSGTNWVIQVLNEMVYSLNNKEPLLENPIVEFLKAEKIKTLKTLPSPRVFASHFYYDDVPKSFLEKKTKTLVVFRNPKDTAVSYFHFYKSNPVLPTYNSWDIFFQDFISGKVCWGSYFDHAVAWNKHINDENVLIVTFEDLKEDFPAELKKISEFFGYSLTNDQIRLVQNKTTFTSMKDKSKDTHGKLADAFFRKGEIGDWKSLFTEAQSQEVDAMFKKYLAGTKLGEKLNYDKYCKY